MKVSKRIQSLASLINSSDVVADIGCDHALVDICLIQNNVVDKILISDVNEKALANGINNIKKYHLEDNIIPKLGFGIETIDDSINTLIISGMGTSTIIKILSNKKLNQIEKLVIESNNDYYLLRSFICSKGFYISHESVIYDSGKYYINIVFLKGHQKYSLKELTFGPILMKSNKDYFEYLYNKNINILDNIPKYKFIERLKIRKANLLLKKLKRK